MYLEITRRCTLECLHCMRGDRQCMDMDEEIIDNALKDVIHIREFDLGGGEPLLVPQIIDIIINKIKFYNIKVDNISFTTNGTVLTPKVIETIKKLQKIAPLNVRLSHDKFHLFDCNLKKLVEIVNRNEKKLTEILGYNPLDKDFVMDNGSIFQIGRAKNLTQDVLDAFNKWLYPTFYHLSFGRKNTLDVIKMYDWDKDIVQVCGTVVISATGYLAQMDNEYELEDKGPIFGINIKNQSLLKALIQYESEYRSSLGEEEYQDYRDEIDRKFKSN